MYATVLEADQYFMTYYGSEAEWFQLEETEKPVLLHRATLALDSRFGRSYRGEMHTNDQPFLFPRTEFVDGDGRTIAEGTIPIRLIHATAEMALYASESADIFGEDNRTGIQSESVSAGSVSTTVSYSDSGSFTDETGKVSIMMEPLLAGTNSSFQFGTSIRG
ncbi:DnaT-like ssDNA-binding protein [Vibrio astriarenae]|uniref:DnaT-like ssDNA-binding protein n=1 Tax=Vibrio astriarenae TaxID=1481923 RepID=UPI003736D35A